MTKDDIIVRANTIRPNTISLDEKEHWVDVIEKDIADHMTQFGESNATPSEDVLLLDERYRDLYVYYVVSMIDLTNQDIAMYNNSCSFFNQLFLSWQKKWRREHTPKNTKNGGD